MISVTHNQYIIILERIYLQYDFLFFFYHDWLTRQRHVSPHRHLHLQFGHHYITIFRDRSILSKSCLFNRGIEIYTIYIYSLTRIYMYKRSYICANEYLTQKIEIQPSVIKILSAKMQSKMTYGSTRSVRYLLLQAYGECFFSSTMKLMDKLAATEDRKCVTLNPTDILSKRYTYCFFIRINSYI